MSETEFLIGRSGLDLVDDFYPDDLPNEWRFDYYSTLFKALSLPIDSEEDLDAIFEELEESDEVFELVLSIEESQLLDATQLISLLKSVEQYQSQFMLFCELTQQPDDKVMSLLKGYQVSFQSDQVLNFDLNTASATGKQLYFNKIPVFYASSAWDEKQIRVYLEDASSVNARSILICKYAEAEVLNKIRVIAEILGF